MAMFGSGMPYGMFGGGQGIFAGGTPSGEIGWAEKIGALLQDLGANYDRRPANSLAMLGYQQQRLGEQKKYQEMLGQLSAPGTASVTNPTLTPGPQAPGNLPQLGPNREIMPRDIAPGPMQVTDPGSLNSTAPGPLAGSQFAQMLPLLQGMDPERGLPLAFNAMLDQQKTANAPPEYRDVGGALYELPRTADGKPTKVIDGPMKAPTTRTIRQGSMDITQEFDTSTGKWREVSKGSAWKPETGGGQEKAPAGYRWGVNGTLEAIPGGPADSTGKNSKATDTQRVTALYADRAREAETVLSGKGKEGDKDYQPGVQGEGTSLAQRARSSIPGVGNYLVSDNFQKYDQAKRNFVNAILRKESGAVISNEEFANAERQYFPQPGDNPNVLSQKRANRETAIEGLKRAAGTAMNDGGNRQQQRQSQAQQTKNIGGVNYVNINGQWYQQ